MTAHLKLYMILLGAKAAGRHVEQHDYFFGIGSSLQELIPQMQAFWPEAGSSLHIDGWREINKVDNYEIRIVPKEAALPSPERLFFINLGGYTAGKLEEQHYTLLSIHTGKDKAIQHAKQTLFFRSTSVKSMKGANSHVDDKYGIDVDDIYNIEDILPDDLKAKYHIQITGGTELQEDVVYLGYYKLNKLPLL